MDAESLRAKLAALRLSGVAEMLRESDFGRKAIKGKFSFPPAASSYFELQCAVQEVPAVPVNRFSENRKFQFPRLTLANEDSGGRFGVQF